MKGRCSDDLNSALKFNFDRPFQHPTILPKIKNLPSRNNGNSYWDFQDILFHRSQPVSLFHEYIKPLFVEALSDSEDFPNVRSSHVLFIIPLVLHTPSSPLIHFCNSLNPAINIVFSFFIKLFPFFNRVASGRDVIQV